MNIMEKTLKTCEKGHEYYKSSDCPVCPVCEKEREVKGFLALLGGPARRALEHEGIDTLQRLAEYTEKEILALHGMGRSSMPKLHKALVEEGLCFKK